MHTLGSLLTLVFVASAQIQRVAGVVDSCPRRPLPTIDLPTCSATHLRTQTKLGDRSLDPSEAEKSASGFSQWEGPSDCIDGYCIFSNQDFGGGCAMITDELNAGRAAEMATALRESQIHSDSFRIVEIPGKGIGTVASRPIRKGELIMVLTPTLLVHNVPHYDMDDAPQASLYQTALQKLPEQRRRDFMNQMGHDIRTKVEKNAFRVFLGQRDDDSGHFGSFPDASKFNHDCRPNVQYRIKNLTHTTVAVRDIAPGEELTVTYIDAMIPRAERTKRLSDWGFNCTCSHCQMSEAEGEASDARLQKIADLEKKLDDFKDPTVTPEMGAEVVALYEEERLDIYLGHIYTRAALNFALFGEVEKAQAYAAIALGAVEREFGPDTGDIKSMRQLAEDPQGHWTWGQRRFTDPDI